MKERGINSPAGSKYSKVAPTRPILGNAGFLLNRMSFLTGSHFYLLQALFFFQVLLLRSEIWSVGPWWWMELSRSEHVRQVFLPSSVELFMFSPLPTWCSGGGGGGAA